jgi:hypothetical protein
MTSFLSGVSDNSGQLVITSGLVDRDGGSVDLLALSDSSNVETFGFNQSLIYPQNIFVLVTLEF